jgi:amino acid transporter
MTSTRPARSIEPDEGREARLRGDLGPLRLLFTLLAFNGPLSVVAGVVPAVIGLGNGLGAPVAFLAAAAVVALFAVGFIAMARHVDRPGGFYSFVTAGLGREIGLGSAFLAVACYYLVLLACYAFSGYAMELLVADTFHGPRIPWWVWAIAIQLIVGVLAYFRLELSARVLSWLLAGEVVIVLVYDAFVVAQGGAGGLTGSAFLPVNVFSGSIGLAMLYATLCMGGFEATVVFRDEVRDPHRTIPRVTYTFIAVVGIFYCLTTWVLIQALGDANAVAATSADPTGSFVDTMATYVGTVGVDLTFVLVSTSVFAAELASHNILARYVFNLAADGILPRALGAVHRRHGSPYRSSVAVSVAVIAGLAPLILVGTAPELLYARLVGGFGYALLLLLLLATVAVAVYLNRTRPVGSTLWQRTLAPGCAFCGIAGTLFFATENIGALVAGGTGLVIFFLALLYGLVAVGAGWALHLRRRRPETYLRIGGER